LITLFQSEQHERSTVPLILGYVLAIASLVWVFRHFQIMTFVRELAAVSWKWVALGMLFDVASYGVQAIRWKLLLAPFGKVRLTRSIRAVYSGLFANLVFPLRPGEVLRSYLVSDSESISLPRVLGSVGVERFVDLVIATAALAIVSLVVKENLPPGFKKVAYTLSIVALVLLVIIVSLVLYLELKLGSSPAPEPGRRRMSSRFMAALTDLHAMGTAPSFYAAVFTSALMPLCQVFALWAMMRAYGLQLSLLAAVIVLLVINVGVSLPNAPANVGSYQFFCVLGLRVFQIEPATATGFSIFAFLALSFPFVFLGFAALLRSGMSLRSMRERVSGRSAQRSPQNSAN
jgi:glycosyltransferase 2 family protein